MRPRYLLFYCILLLPVHNAYAQQGIEFIENKGQWGDWFKYKVATRGGDVCLENDGFRFILSDKTNNLRVDSFHHGASKVKPVLKFHCYKMTFDGADVPEIQGEKPEKVYYNYFLGNDSAHWKSGIHPFRNVNYSNIYKGIDVHVGSDKGNIVYDFILKPNADASQIRLKFDGQNSLTIRDHNAVIGTSLGEVTEMRPYAYQYINYNKVEVPCEYKVKGNVLWFSFPSGYDHSQQLIIDPTVVFCTLTGSTADNWGFTATYDDAGNFYNGGLVNALAYPSGFGGHFPVSPGAFQDTFGGGNATGGTSVTYGADISIIKYDPTGVNRIYATYLGGSDNERPHSMIVDGSNNLIVAGRSASTNFPVTPGAYKTANSGGWDIIVTKFNSTGTALIGSTYIGGSGTDGVNYDSTEYGYGQLKFNYGDDARSEVQMDKLGNIYVTGCTNSTDFPTTPTAISSTLSGIQDGVVFKFNSTLTTLLWSTYIGGTGYDAGYVLAFDTAQASVYVAGGTNSTNFPATAGTLHSTFQGGRADGFILKFKNSAPYNLLKGTFVGTPNYDQVYGIQVSDDDHVYVMGQSLGGTFPVTAGVYSNPNSCQFIMKTDNNLATDLVSTVFGNSNPDSTNISPVAFLVDTCENVYISGWGGDLGISGGIDATGTCNGMPVTPDAVRGTTSGRDFYFIVLGSGMTTLRYATYYGRYCAALWEGAHVDGGTSRFDKHGIIYQAMCANCGGVYNAATNPGGCIQPYPTTSGVWSMIDSSANCNEAALKIAFNIGPVTASITAGPSTSGCAPLTVDFTNTSNNGLTFVWNFGDGSAIDTSYSPVHTFTAGGVYTVSLSAANSNACFRTTDTAHYVIVVDTNIITPGFTAVIQDSCGPYTVTLTNTSTSTATGTSTYLWTFGDGATYSGTTPPTHSYPDTGSYTITLVMTNANACNSPDSVTQTIDISSYRMSANFTIPDSICEGNSFFPAENIVNALTYSWSFGDGQFSTDTMPKIQYDSVGTFTVILVTGNTGACNTSDTITEHINVLPVPLANFSYTPVTPVPNTPTVFTNHSLNATRYSWDFGDGTGSTDVSPTHQFNKTGTYKVCLTAYNNTGCTSIACREIQSDINPIVGVPSGFSPNGDGSNEILYVRGAAISTLDLKIYNRWGQLIFETTSQDKGWDGTFNGQPQPMDAYAYVLLVSFIDGTAQTLKGSITLLR